MVQNVVNTIDSHVLLRQQKRTKNAFKSIFLAETKRIIIHLKSIIMDYIKSRKSHQKGFFFHFVYVSRRADFCKSFCVYQMGYAEFLQSEWTA